MATRTAEQRISDHGWYGFKIIDGEDVPWVNGAKPGVPVILARKRMDAPYPDVQVAVPVDVGTLQRWLSGDRLVGVEIVQQFEQAVAQLVAAEG